MSFFHYVGENWQQIWLCLTQHVKLTGLAVLFAVLIGVPLGILISYVKRLHRPVMGFANLMQAVPSLALLGFLIPLLGIGTKPGICMVVVYSLLPIIKNTATGLRNIDRDIVETAAGIGLTRMQILLRIKLPLALPIIMAGIRISAVTAVGLVTISAFIGAGGLGYLVYSGIRTINTNQILAGAVPACLLALTIDFLASIIEDAVTPVSMRRDAKTLNTAKIKRLKRWRITVLICTGLIFLLILAVAISSEFIKSDKKIAIGSKSFTEQVILGHIYSELVEAKTDLIVDRKFELGSPSIVFEALRIGELDMYPEYTGTIYGMIMKETEARKAPEVYEMTKKYLQERYNLIFMDYLGFNNTYDVMVTKETAERYNLKTLSDLARVAPELIGGFGMEFMNRKDGLIAMAEGYGIQFKETVAIDGGVPKYMAITNNQVQASEAFSTDGMLVKFDLVLLKDDKELFLPYYIAPLVRADTLEKHPELKEIFNLLAGKISDAQMRHMNYLVEVEHRNAKEVAIEFLKEHQLL